MSDRRVLEISEVSEKNGKMYDKAESGSFFKYKFAELLVFIAWSLLRFLTFIGRSSERNKGTKGMLKNSGSSPSLLFDRFLFTPILPLAQIREFASYAKSLEIIYNYFKGFGIDPDGIKEGWWKGLTSFSFINWLLKKYSDFWIGMPVAQDVRTRLRFVAKETRRAILQIHKEKIAQGEKLPEIKVVVIAAGTAQDMVIAVKNVLYNVPDIRLKIVCIEPDRRFSRARFDDLANMSGIPAGIISHVGGMITIGDDINERSGQKDRSVRGLLAKNGHDFSEFDLVICVGLGDYMFGDKLPELIKMLDNGARIITANVSADPLEHFFLHRIIQWPAMQHLSLNEYKGVLVSSFGQGRKMRVVQSPHNIFLVAIVEPKESK